MEKQETKAVPVAPGVRVEVTWKGGAQQHIALSQAEIESGDLLKLTGPFEGRFIQLMGTDAHGVKKYTEVDEPKGAKVGDPIKLDDEKTGASPVERLMASVKFPEPGESKPLIGDDGKPLPAPKGNVVVPPAPTAPAP